MGRARRASAMLGTYFGMALSGTLLGCSDGAGESVTGEGGASASASYLIAARMTSPEGRRTYFVPVPSLDTGLVYDLDGAVEAIDGWVFGQSGVASFWHAGQREATIARWNVGPDGAFERGDVLSFAQLGMNQVGGARRSVFVAPDRAYFIEETHPEEVIIWNPEAMTVIGTIPLGVEALGALEPRALLVGQGSRLLVTVQWRDLDSATWADHVRLLVVDPASDTVTSSSDDTRCGSLVPSGATADGSFYFSAESGGAPIRSLLGSPYGYASCVLRIAPDAATFDPAFSPDLVSLAGGRPVGAVLLLDERQALMDVWHQEDVDPLLPDASNWDDVRRQAGFRRWRLDTQANGAESVPGAPAIAMGSLDELRRFALDGQQFVSELSEDSSTNLTSELLPSGELRARFSGPGQVVGLVRLR